MLEFFNQNIMDATYGYKKEVDMSFEDAVEKAKNELKNEGFGVLTEIDVKATLRKKLDVDFDNYIILGACHPQNAYKALQSERDIGLMLPCNVIVYVLDGKTFVPAILPSIAMSMIGNMELGEIAGQIEEKLKRTIDNVA